MARRILAAAAGLTLALSLAACGGSTKAKPSDPATPITIKIMVGGLNKQIYLPAMLTKQLGFFEKQGLNVELSDEPSGVSAEDAMLAGQVDAVVGFYDHNIDLQSKGKMTQSVVQFSQVPGEVELCRTDVADQIKSPADWKGRKLGVTGLGSSTNFLTQYLAVHNGLKVSDITTVAVQAGPTFIAAVDHKAIDCGMTTEPTITALLSSEKAKVLLDMRTVDGTRSALGGLYPAACLYMQASFAQNNKAAVQKLANAFVQTLKWINSHSAAEITDKLPADYYAGIGKDAYIKALDAEKAMFTPDGVMPEGGPQTVLQVLNAFDPTVKGRTIDLPKTYTTEFTKNAAAA